MSPAALGAALWRVRGTCLLLFLLVYGAGAGVVLAWPRAYVAQLVVAPQDSTSISTSAMLSPVPMFNSPLLDTRPSGNFAVYLAGLRSHEAALDLLASTDLRRHLESHAVLGVGGLLRRLGLLGPPLITADDASDWLERNSSATPSLVNITWTLEVRATDQRLALALLERLHRFAEGEARNGLASLVEARITHLNGRLAREQDQFIRAILYDLLGQQSRFSMVLAADQAVAARVLSAPFVEDEPSLPNRPLLLVLLLPASGLLALGAASMRVLLRRGRAGLPADPRLGLMAGE